MLCFNDIAQFQIAPEPSGRTHFQIQLCHAILQIAMLIQPEVMQGAQMGMEIELATGIKLIN